MLINRNSYIAELFAQLSYRCGVRHAVISPGSRSTPLVFAFAQNKNFVCHSILDERSAAFYATGLARSLQEPVALICTSGTAVAEYLPAVIEAYHQKIPLLLLTADRPFSSLNKGVNQTINQRDLFRHFTFAVQNIDADINDEKSLLKISSDFVMALKFMKWSNEPFHLNIAFEKPLEPFTSTGRKYKISAENLALTEAAPKFFGSGTSKSLPRLGKGKSVILSLGPVRGKNDFQSRLIQLAEKYSLPILADTSSGMTKFHSKNVIGHFPLFINNPGLHYLQTVGTVIHYGLFHSSSSVEKLFRKQQPLFIEVSDSDGTINPLDLRYRKEPENERTIEKLEQFCAASSIDARNLLLRELKSASALAEKTISNCKTETKPVFYSSLSKLIPEDSFVFIGNSLSAREMNSFWFSDKDIPVFHNRGASGIDGLLASAAGVTEGTGLPGVAIMGDLSFFYDLTSLHLLKMKKLNLKVIVMNNNGGGIFHSLPVAKTPEKKIFNDYFITPQGLSIKELTKGFGLPFYKCDNPQRIQGTLEKLLKDDKPAVLELLCNFQQDKTDAEDIKTAINQAILSSGKLL